MDEKLLHRLETAFPSSADAETFRGISEGVLLADDLMNNTPLLKTLVGKDLKGHIRRAGVMFRIHGMSISGDLPYSADMVKMPYGNWHFLEIRSGRFKAHVCRTNGADDFPIETLSRQDARLANQGDLFSEKVASLDEIASRLPELYAWLTFGAQKNGSLSHLCWAMPPADDGDWLAHVNIMDRMATSHAGGPTGKPPETPAPIIKLRFKQHIEESLGADKKAKDKK
jgi:hypothetical protein